MNLNVDRAQLQVLGARGASCAGCTTGYGVRYKCSVCRDVNFCERCERHPDHHVTVPGHDATHPLLKILAPPPQRIDAGPIPLVFENTQ